MKKTKISVEVEASFSRADRSQGWHDVRWFANVYYSLPNTCGSSAVDRLNAEAAAHYPRFNSVLNRPLGRKTVLVLGIPADEIHEAHAADFERSRDEVWRNHEDATDRYKAATGR